MRKRPWIVLFAVLLALTEAPIEIGKSAGAAPGGSAFPEAVRPPVIALFSPPDRHRTGARGVFISGMVDDPTAEVVVNERPVSRSNQHFLSFVLLEEGVNRIVVEAGTWQGGRSSTSLTVIRENPSAQGERMSLPPPPEPPLIIRPTEERNPFRPHQEQQVAVPLPSVAVPLPSPPLPPPLEGHQTVDRQERRKKRVVAQGSYGGYRLGGILYSAEKAWVIVNSRIMRRGDTIDGYQIADIMQDRVLLKREQSAALENSKLEEADEIELQIERSPVGPEREDEERQEGKK